MSRVYFYANLFKYGEVEVAGGWDPPLQYYHFTISDVYDENDRIIYSCLDDSNVFQNKSNDKYKKILDEFGIIPPEGFWDLCDKKEENVMYSYKNNIWIKY